MNALARRHEHADARRARKQLGEQASDLLEVLDMVEHQQELLRPHVGEKLLALVSRALEGEAQRARDSRDHLRFGFDRGKGHEVDTVRVCRRLGLGSLDGQPGLADAARAE